MNDKPSHGMKYEVCIELGKFSVIVCFLHSFLEKFHASFKLFMQILANLHDDFEVYMGTKGSSALAHFPSLATMT